MKTFARFLMPALMAALLQTGLAATLSLPGSPLLRASYAQEWRTEFDDICRKTTDAMSLSKEELRQLVGRTEKLKVVIETLEETEKKVYLRRLRLCRDLFVFVLESKEKD